MSQPKNYGFRDNSRWVGDGGQDGDYGQLGRDVELKKKFVSIVAPYLFFTGSSTLDSLGLDP